MRTIQTHYIILLLQTVIAISCVMHIYTSDTYTSPHQEHDTEYTNTTHEHGTDTTTEDTGNAHTIDARFVKNAWQDMSTPEKGMDESAATDIAESIVNTLYTVPNLVHIFPCESSTTAELNEGRVCHIKHLLRKYIYRISRQKQTLNTKPQHPILKTAGDILTTPNVPSNKEIHVTDAINEHELSALEQLIAEEEQIISPTHRINKSESGQSFEILTATHEYLHNETPLYLSANLHISRHLPIHKSVSFSPFSLQESITLNLDGKHYTIASEKEFDIITTNKIIESKEGPNGLSLPQLHQHFLWLVLLDKIAVWFLNHESYAKWFVHHS